MLQPNISTPRVSWSGAACVRSQRAQCPTQLTRTTTVVSRPSLHQCSQLIYRPPLCSVKAPLVLERPARALRGRAAERDGARRGAPCGWGSRS